MKIFEDFTPEEIQKFDSMHLVLRSYNASLGTKNELPLPEYTNVEMSAYSVYRELLIAHECEE